MSNHTSDSERIRVKKDLGKAAPIGPLPGDMAFAWLAIIAGVIVFYILINQFIPIAPAFMVYVAVSLIVAHWFLFGNQPWKYGGKFHKPKDYVLGYPKLQLQGQEQLKPTLETQTVGWGDSRRKVKAFEDELQLATLVQFELNNDIVGAYLLQNKRLYRLVFVWDCYGINPYQNRLLVAKIVQRLRDGFKELFENETLTLHFGTFARNRIRIVQLDRLIDKIHLSPIKYLLTALKKRVEQLTDQGKHNPKFFRIYTTYTLSPAGSKAGDPVEEVLASLEAAWKTWTGIRQEGEKLELEACLRKAFQCGFLANNLFLEKQLGLPVKACTPREIFLFDWQRFNQIDKDNLPPPIPQLLIVNKKGIDWKINSSVHITTCLFQAGAPVADKKWVYLPGLKSYCGGAVYTQKPGTWNDAIAQIESGSKLIHSEQVRDTEIFVEVFKPNQDLALAVSEQRTKNSNLNVNLAAQNKRLDIGASYNTRQNASIEESFHDGEVALNLAWMAIVYRDHPEQLQTPLEHLNKLDAFPNPAKVEREKGYFDTMWLETLPYTWRRLLVKPFDRRQQYFASEAIGLMPLLMPQTSARHGLELICGTGFTPVYLDLYGQKPQHCAIVGTTGSGKSLFLGEVCNQALGAGLDVTIIDSTREDGTGTFTDFTNFVGGSYYNCINESLNLLETVDVRDIDDPLKKQAVTALDGELTRQTLLMLVADSDTPKHLKKRYRSIINLCLKAFNDDPEIRQRYSAAHRDGFGSPAYRRMPTLVDFVNYVTPDSLSFELDREQRSAVTSVRMELEAILDTTLGQTISRPSSIRTDSHLVVFGIGGVDNEEDLSILALTAYSVAIRRSVKSQRSLVDFDEASYLAGNFDYFARILGATMAKGRKAGISAIYCGQDLDSILNTRNAKQILDNTSNYLIGSLQDTAVETISKALGIPSEVLLDNTLNNFSPPESELASRWLVKNRSTLAQCLYYGASEQIALLANEPEFVALRHQYFQKYPNKYQALSALAQSMRSSLSQNELVENDFVFSHNEF